MSAAHESLRSLLYETFREKPRPILRGEHFCIPGASIWSGARLWVNRLRGLGVVRHDRVLVGLPRTPAHVMATIACWWEGITLCPVTLASEPIDLLHRLGARLLLADIEHPSALSRGEDEAPDTRALVSCASPRTSAGLAISSSHAAMLFPAAPGAADPRPLALSTDALLHALAHHARALAIEPDEPWISHKAWHGAEGLLSDLWPALLSGADVQVAPRAEPGAAPRTGAHATPTALGGSVLNCEHRSAGARAA